MSVLKTIAAWAGWREGAGLNVPPLDGSLKPNNLLELASRPIMLPAIDNVVATATEIYFSAGHELFKTTAGYPANTLVSVKNFPAEITFVALSADGMLAVGVMGQGVQLASPGQDWSLVSLPTEVAACLTAAAFFGEERLVVCVGSRIHGATQWKHDLMSKGRSGVILSIDLRTKAVKTIASGLGYPSGISIGPDGALTISESWRHRIIRLESEEQASPRTVLDDLPAYPARLAPSMDGGFWLSLFAPRRQLFEFVLQEDDYRKAMMETITSVEWIGPELSSGDAPDQPLQAGSIRQMGLIKPWAPSRSYGLIARCDANMAITKSWHSRADGTMHGITSTAEVGGTLYATSRGSGTLLAVDLSSASGSGERV